MPPSEEGPSGEDEDRDDLDMPPLEEGPSREEDDHMSVMDVPDDQALVDLLAFLSQQPL